MARATAASALVHGAPRPDRPLPSPKARPGQVHRRVERLGGCRGPGHRCLRPGERRELSRPGPRRSHRPGPIDRCLRPKARPGQVHRRVEHLGGYRGPGHRCLRPGRGCDLPCQHRPADLVLHGVVDIYLPQRQKSTYQMLLGPLRPSLVRWDRRSPRPGRGCERRRAAGPPGRRSRACQVRIAPGPKRVRTRHGSRREQSPASATGYPRGG